MKDLKILFVGNSFAVDTMEHTANIALSLGIEKIKFCTLYVGGCSIDMHYAHAMGDLPVYTYYTNEGEGWKSVSAHRISDAVKSEDTSRVPSTVSTSNSSRGTSPETL